MSLDAFDRVFAGHAVAIVLAYPSPLDGGELADALDQAARIAPGLSGRVVTTDATSLPADVADPRALGDLIPPLGARTIEARLTRGPSGCTLGVTMSHAVVDGFSFFAFLRAWSRAAAGHAALPPPSDRAVFSAGAAPAQDPAELFRRTGFTWLPGRERAPVPRAFGAPVALDAIEPARGLSLNDLICATLVRRLGPELAGADDLALVMPVDCRRLLAGVPNNYFGNAVRCAPLVLSRPELAASVPEIAGRVQAAVKTANDEAGARDALACLEAFDAWDELHLVHPDAGLLVTNVSRLPFGMIDFGAGPPSRAFLPAMEPRTAVIQQRDDGIDVSFLP